MYILMFSIPSILKHQVGEQEQLTPSVYLEKYFIL